MAAAHTGTAPTARSRACALAAGRRSAKGVHDTPPPGEPAYLLAAGVADGSGRRDRQLRGAGHAIRAKACARAALRGRPDAHWAPSCRTRPARASSQAAHTHTFIHARTTSCTHGRVSEGKVRLSHQVRQGCQDGRSRRADAQSALRVEGVECVRARFALKSLASRS
jgi:hypothetical protein